MPKYKITAPDGNNYFVEGPGSADEALAHFQSNWKPAPAPKAPLMTPESVADISGKVGGVAGLALPYVTAASEGTLGASAVPITAGLAGTIGAGYLADKAMNYPIPSIGAPEGIGGALKKGGQYIREHTMGEPKTQSVAGNLALNTAQEFLTPQGLAANTLEAAPNLASAYIASKVGPAISGAPGWLSRKLLGNTVPAGQNSAALQGAMERGLPVSPQPEPKTGGELLQNMQAMKQELGAPIEAARAAGYEAAGVPKDMPGMVKGAIRQGLVEQGVPVRRVVGSTGPMPGILEPELAGKGATQVAKIGSKLAPKVTGLEDANAMQRQFAKRAAELRKAGKDDQAGFFEEASRQIDKAIMDTMPAENQAAIAEANKPFSSLRTVQDVAKKSFGPQGDQSPEGVVKAWNLLTPKQKAGMSPEFVKQMDALTKQSPGLVGKLSIPSWRSLLQGKGLTPPPTFSKPIPQMSDILRENTGIGGALAGLLAGQ